MAYLALYRRYRPKTFDKLIGQEHVVKTLVNQIENQRLGHAYLFTGTRGTGKTSAAKIFAKAINCLNPVNGSPCDECEACRSLSDPSNIDVIEIDAASNNGVNEIRELRENVQYPPVSCKYKVYIIDEVHMLSGAAFNALLKTLEEPPKHAVFILATTEVHKIPATILSRCMRFDFRLIPLERIASLIAEIFDEQGKEYDKEAITAIAKAGEGSIRDALSIADTAISYGKGKLTYSDVMNILGSSGLETTLEFIGYVLNGETGKILESIDRLCEQGKSVGVLIKDITSLLRDILIIKSCGDANDMLALPVDKYQSLEKIGELASEEKILRALEVFSDAENTLKYSNHSRIVFETASIKASRPETDYNIEALLTRIKELEEKIAKGNFTVKTVEAEKVVAKEKIEKEQKIEKTTLSQLGAEKIKSKILTALRCDDGEKMLWGIMQSVGVSVDGNVLVLTPSSLADGDVLNNKNKQEKIINSLKECLPFELQVEEYRREKLLSDVDAATEKVKKLFGDDIVIIKQNYKGD